MVYIRKCETIPKNNWCNDCGKYHYILIKFDIIISGKHFSCFYQYVMLAEKLRNGKFNESLN